MGYQHQKLLPLLAITSLIIGSQLSAAEPSKAFSKPIFATSLDCASLHSGRAKESALNIISNTEPITLPYPTLSTTDAEKIGLLIWQNEASQRVDLLTFWNPNESFPSLGIGHFIWHSAGTTIPYTEQFPALCH